ncbi:hypothetical protein AQUCO_03500100v1 [Aquilegia coerulea]|uniref:PGG domain-containing protein n=1 Tax=Aquilegia coerulea TaxID=218851 RepID=A0A2G5CW61_AQUCA|nr:hypothetical protein AQUCO_03500100v1 [Aquilegia coerulea]
MDLFNRVSRGDLEYLKKVELDVLLNSRDQDRSSVLCIATRCNQLDCCKEILKRCSSLLYHQNHEDKSVLHHAVCVTDYRLMDFFLSAGLDATKSEGDAENMIRYKKWINLQSVGNTALIVAISRKNYYVVKKFVDVDSQYKLSLSGMIKAYKMIKMLTDSRYTDHGYGANVRIVAQ